MVANREEYKRLKELAARQALSLVNCFDFPKLVGWHRRCNSNG